MDARDVVIAAYRENMIGGYCNAHGDFALAKRLP